MVFGHNTNVKIAGITYHVQTEDRGEAHALIDTTVYYQGRVLHRRTNNYFDLLPSNEDRRQALKLRVDEQHHSVLEEMQSGALQVSVPKPALEPAADLQDALQGTPLAASGRPDAGEALAHPVGEPRKLRIELMNRSSWLSGKQAALQVSIREENGDPVADARIEVHIDGSERQQTYRSDSGIYGQAQIEFEMPRITKGEAVMVIRAEHGRAAGQLRFALRAKSRVPSVP